MLTNSFTKGKIRFVFGSAYFGCLFLKLEVFNKVFYLHLKIIKAYSL